MNSAIVEDGYIGGIGRTLSTLLLVISCLNGVQTGIDMFANSALIFRLLRVLDWQIQSVVQTNIDDDLLRSKADMVLGVVYSLGALKAIARTVWVDGEVLRLGGVGWSWWSVNSETVGLVDMAYRL